MLLHPAGFTWDGMIHKITPKQWDAMLAVHCTAPFRLIQVPLYLKPPLLHTSHRFDAMPNPPVEVSCPTLSRAALMLL